MTVKRAINYVRVSTDEQAKGYSLQTQIKGCRRYAEEMGHAIAATFQDDYTGTSLDRPALNEMREYLGLDKTVSNLIVYDLDRIARKSVHQMILEEELRRFGVTVEYVIGRYDDSDEGRLQKQIRASIAGYEKMKIDATSRKLMEERIELCSHLNTTVLDDVQIYEIERFCASIQGKLETASFEAKRHLIEMFDVHGKLTIEDDQKFIEVTCLISPQPRSLALTSHLSNTGAIVTTPCASLPTARSR